MTNRLLLFTMLLPATASAQFHFIQNSDFGVLAGPSFSRTQTIAATNATLYNSTGYVYAIDYGYQFMRKSGFSIWADFALPSSTRPSAQTGSVPGSISLDSLIEAPGCA